MKKIMKSEVDNTTGLVIMWLIFILLLAML